MAANGEQASSGGAHANLALERVRRVMRFLGEVSRRRSPAIRMWDDHDWSLDLGALPEHPMVLMGGEEVDDPGLVLRVRRPKETTCPAPPQILVDWLLPGWGPLDAEPKVQATRHVTRDEATVTIRFDDDAKRTAALTAWKEKHAEWSDAERPARRTIALFERLFELRSRIERQSESFTLYAGDGMLKWDQPDPPINQVLFMQRLELSFDAKTPQFEIRQTSEPMEINAQLLRELQADGRALNALRTKVAENEIGLLDGEFTSVIAEAVHSLFADGLFVEHLNGDACEKPTAHRRPVVFLAPRTAGLTNAIDRFLERLEESTTVPSPLRSIVTAGEDDHGEGDSSSDPVFGTVLAPKHSTRPEAEEVDLLLTKPANPEQEAVVRSLARTGQVVVQGPPGTGKSHTIANLIGHLLAEGKSVLVTSYTTKALRVLREHITDDLRPLCATVLDGDSESQALLETSVRGIIAGLQQPLGDRTTAAERSRKARDKLAEQLKEQERAVRSAIRDEYDDIIVGGKTFQPSRAARQVAESQKVHSWLPGPLEPGVLCPLSEDEVRELYQLNVEITEEDEVELAVGMPTSDSVPEPDEFKATLEAIADAEKKAANDRSQFWKTEAVSTPERLSACRVKLSRVLKSIRKSSPLMLECMDCGRLGGARREPWDDLIKTVRELSAQIDEDNGWVTKYSPRLHERWPPHVAAAILTQMLARLPEGGRLSIWSALARPWWLLLQRTSWVQGRKPVDRPDFEALLASLRLQDHRSALLARWTAQVTSVEPGKFENLGERAEDGARHHASDIENALGWHSGDWTDFLDDLQEMGFDWEAALALIQHRSDRYGLLLRWGDAIEKVVFPVLEARRYSHEVERLHMGLDQTVARLRSPRRNAIGTRLADAITRHDPSEYAAIHARYKELVRLQVVGARRKELLDRLEPCAAVWAEEIASREPAHATGTAPGGSSEAWLWRQLAQELTRRASTDVNQLQQAVTETKDRLQQETARYVSAMVWGRQHRRTSGAVRAALFNWLQTVSQRGFKSGIRSNLLKAEARRLLNDARQAVPVWIMPLPRVVESYDFKVAQFDVVILDEASQCDITGLLALGIAKSAIIVGDDKQVSPMAVGEDLLAMQTLIDEYLDGVPGKNLFTGRLSMYDLGTANFGQTVRLVEHFRCVDDIIQFSNHLSYDGEIKPLRESSAVMTRPFVVSHRVTGGERYQKINEAEALEIASLVAAMIEHPDYKGKSIGVISMLGAEQAMLVDKLLRERISISEYAARRILCGTPAQFQGDERDVILLTLIDHAKDGPLTRRTDDDLKKRYNVAVSRARDQLWAVHSLNADTDLKEGDLRQRLLKHLQDPQAVVRQVQQQGQKVESEFERRVLKSLSESGYRVDSQWRVGAFRIDMVVTGSEGRVALECDGDRFHPPEDLVRDLDRQRILERLGWRFVRLRGSEFFRDPEQAMTRVRQELSRFAVEPIGAVSSDADVETNLRDSIVRRAEELRREWFPEDDDQEDKPELGDVEEIRFEPLSSSDTDGNGDGRRVLAALREAGTPLARSELLERTGIALNRWQPTIQALLSNGTVLRRGARRGTRYVLAFDEPSAESSLFEPTSRQASEVQVPNAKHSGDP